MPIEIKAYKCQFCKGDFVRQKIEAVIKHETWCYKNPNNISLCSNCRNYLRNERVTVGVVYTRHETKDIDAYHYCTELECGLVSKRMTAMGIVEFLMHDVDEVRIQPEFKPMVYPGSECEHFKPIEHPYFPYE